MYKSRFNRLEGFAISALGLRSRKLSDFGRSSDRRPKIDYPELIRASGGALSRLFQLHMQSLAPTNPHRARVVGYGPFFLCVIHKEGTPQQWGH
jgi:hypothetical protein